MPAPPALELEACIGFNSKIPSGFAVVNHASGTYHVHAQGANVVVKDVANNTQVFCVGHTSTISCIAVSPDGAYIATGQENEPGFKAPIHVWDLDQIIANWGGSDRAGELRAQLLLHMGSVQDLSFSYDSQFLASVGGQDDNSLVVWEAATGTAICGSPAATDSTRCVTWYKGRSDRLITGGNYNMRVWRFELGNRKLWPTDVSWGNLQRIVTTLTVDDSDDFVFAGSTTGDLLQVALVEMADGEPMPRLAGTAPIRFEMGVNVIVPIRRDSGEVVCIIGSGSGTVAMVSMTKKRCRRHELMGGVTSINLGQDRESLTVCTNVGNTYTSAVELLDAPELVGTCHSGPISDVVFPGDCSELFLTSSGSDIRVWNARLRQELLRIQVPNLDCTCIELTQNGGTIVSGWNDGKIRAFYPESGALAFVIQNAHIESCTALAVTHEEDTGASWRIISGGHDGRVRVWNVTAAKQKMEATLKEHRGPISSIAVMRDNTQAVTASEDGSCIVWDIVNYLRLNAMFANTNFSTIRYHPDESQYLTTGTDRKVTYWDAFDASAIRVIDGSDSGAVGGGVTSLDIDGSGGLFASAGEDKLVNLWHYDEGDVAAQGTGHSGTVTAVKISPDGRTVVSVGDEGAVMIWRVPDSVYASEEEKE